MISPYLAGYTYVDTTRQGPRSQSGRVAVPHRPRPMATPKVLVAASLGSRSLCRTRKPLRNAHKSLRRNSPWARELCGATARQPVSLRDEPQPSERSRVRSVAEALAELGALCAARR